MHHREKNMRKEIHRQFIHFVGGNLAIGVLSATLLLGIEKWILVAVLIAAFMIGYLLAKRVQKGHKVTIIHDLIKHVEREEEKKDFPAKPAFLLLAGIIFTIALFDPLPAIIGIVVLTYGDTVATLIGKYSGKIELISNRTLEGTVAGIIAATIPLLFLLDPSKAIGIAIVGMLAEYLPIDDNIGIPLVGALAAKLLI